MTVTTVENFSIDHCPVCKGSALLCTASSLLSQCTSCGHQFTTSPPQLAAYDNEILSLSVVQSKDLLTRAKVTLLKRWASPSSVVLDLGSSSGKFLYHLRPHVREVYGVEVSSPAVAFSQDQLKLEIFKDCGEASKFPITHVTCWHSLEHIPAETIREIFSQFRKSKAGAPEVIVAVPNKDSLQWRLFTTDWTYYDAEAHLCQYSSRSLDSLMMQCGFMRVETTTLFIYEVFGYLQSIINLFIKPHNYLYYKLKRGDTTNKNILNFFGSLIVGSLAIAPSLVLSAYSTFFKSNAGVLVARYKAQP